MSEAPEARPDPGTVEELSEEFVHALADYERHLAVERNLSAHTVRAYLGDLASLLTHLSRLGADSLVDLDRRALRSWLANQHTRGKARSTQWRIGWRSTSMGEGMPAVYRLDAKV